MKKAKVWKQLLEELERTPIVQVACDKVGISRNTYYIWIKDESALDEIREARQRGIDLVNDVAESNVLTGIKNKDAGYTKYWLSSRHEAYKKPYTHRDAVADPFEAKRIEDYYRNRKNIEKVFNALSREEAEANTKKALAFMEKWTKKKKNPPKTI